MVAAKKYLVGVGQGGPNLLAIEVLGKFSMPNVLSMRTWFPDVLVLNSSVYTNGWVGQ